MCLSKAYVTKNGGSELLLEEVASLTIEDGSLLLKTLFGEEKEVPAKVRKVDFMTHSIFLENLKEEGVSPKDE